MSTKKENMAVDLIKIFINHNCHSSELSNISLQEAYNIFSTLADNDGIQYYTSKTVYGEHGDLDVNIFITQQSKYLKIVADPHMRNKYVNVTFTDFDFGFPKSGFSELLSTTDIDNFELFLKLIKKELATNISFDSIMTLRNTLRSLATKVTSVNITKPVVTKKPRKTVTVSVKTS